MNCRGRQNSSVSESKTVSIRMEWLTVLSAAWRLRIVRTEKYPMDLAIRKQWVAFEKFRVEAQLYCVEK